MEVGVCSLLRAHAQKGLPPGPRRVAAAALAKHRRSSALQFGPQSFPLLFLPYTSTIPYRQCFNHSHQYIDHHKVLRSKPMQSFFASGTFSISRCTVR